MKTRVLGLGIAAVILVAIIVMAHASPLLLIPFVAFGALQTRTSNEGNTASDQIVKLEFSDITGGTTPVALTCGHADDALTTTTDKFKGWFGERSIRKNIKLDLWVLDVKTANTAAFLNDLETKIVAWVKVTYGDGITKTYDSGTTGIPVMNFVVDWDKKENALGWHVVGTGKMGVGNL